MMSVQLRGDVGAQGQREDVLIVQTLLANIAERPGQMFWREGLTGFASHSLSMAIERFQTVLGLNGTHSGDFGYLAGSDRSGVVGPHSRTWQALLDYAPSWSKAFRILPNGQPPVAYWTKDLRRTAQKAVSETDRQRLIPDQALRQRLLQTLLRLEQEVGLAAGVGWFGLDREMRMSLRLTLHALYVTDSRTGMMASAADDAGAASAAVPRPLWDLVSRGMRAGDWIEATGHHGTGGGTFVLAPPLTNSSEIQAGRAQFDHFRINAAQFRVDERLLAGALGLISKRAELDQASQGRLELIIRVAGQLDPRAGEALEERYRAVAVRYSAEWAKYQSSEDLKRILRQAGKDRIALALAGLVTLSRDFAMEAGLLGAVVATGRAAANTSAFRGLAKAALTIELVAFGIKVLDQGYENVLTVEVLKRVENIDGSRDSTAGIEIPKGKTRKQTLMEIFDLRALRVGPDMEPDVIKLMEQILLSGVRGSGVRNDHIASRILKLRTVDGHAAYRLNRVFSIAREPTNPTNLRYRPTAQLRKLFEQRRIGSVITQYVDLIAASTGIARGDVIEYVLFAYENETEAAISAARSELIRRGFER